MLLDLTLIFYSVLAVTLTIKELIKHLKIPRLQRNSPYVLRCKSMIINNKISPHTIIVGNSGQGKSKLAEYLVKDRNDIDVTLINCYPDDFASLTNVKRLTEIAEIMDYLGSILNTVHETPLYLVVDEVLALSMQDKKINKLLTSIVAKGRHHAVFLIVIAQYGTREELPFKNLVGNRIAFSMIEESNYKTILGFAPENTQLKAREFVYLSSNGTGRSKCPKL